MKTGEWGRFLGAGLQIAAGILFGLFGGLWADRRFGTSPWLLLAGIVLGAISGFYALFKEYSKKT